MGEAQARTWDLGGAAREQGTARDTQAKNPVQEGDIARETLAKSISADAQDTQILAWDIYALTAAVAHEIKNPVALAMANVALIRLTDESQVMEGYCEGIEQSLKSINALTQLFLPPESPELQAVDLSALLETTVAAYRAAWPQMRIYFVHPARLPAVRGEAAWIRMVFTNLLKNAAEAAGSQGEITLSATGNDESVTVQITDNGSGIDPETALKLAEGRYSAKAGGSGIGLMICRYIIARHGGRFTLRNREGGGCEAVVILPRR